MKFLFKYNPQTRAQILQVHIQTLQAPSQSLRSHFVPVAQQFVLHEQENVIACCHSEISLTLFTTTSSPKPTGVFTFITLSR